MIVSVSVFNAHAGRRVPGRRVASWVRVVLRGERRRARVSVIFIGDGRSRSINRRYLGHDTNTDVLSFTLEGRENPEGEIYVNLDRARRQAQAYRVTYENEVARLVVHGTLHLLGYDDRTPAGTRRMTARQERYIDRMFGRRKARRIK